MVDSKLESLANNQIDKNKYKKLSKIGSGAYGKAYLVENTTTKKQLVIKTIFLDSMSDKEVNDAIKEAQIMSSLDHPNIIHFEECFIMKKPKLSMCIVMDFANGGDLKQRITEQKKKGKYFQQNQILDWLCQICLAIKHIHDRKILHRDLKSQNVFLTSSNIIKLGDFGVAKCLDYTLQKAETYIGTPYYLSPEIIRGETYSFKSDIWSIGILLYEMITLKMPFEGESIGDLNRKIEKGNYKSIPSDYDQNIRKLLTLMLSVEEAKRPTIHEILRLPFIQQRIKSFLSEVEYDEEFSHTILHNYNPLKPIREDSLSVSNTSISEDTKKKDYGNINFQNETSKLTAKNSNANEKSDAYNTIKMMKELKEIEKEILNTSGGRDTETILKHFEEMDSVISHDQTIEQKQIKEIQAELEKLFGEQLYSKAFKIIDENVPKNSIIYDLEKIKKAFLSGLSGVDSSIVEKLISKIPDIFSLVIHERESRFKNAKNK